jgi:hypothetical protein
MNCIQLPVRAARPRFLASDPKSLVGAGLISFISSYMESRSNCKTPTRQLASSVHKLKRLTRLYLNLGLRSQDALRAADADLKQLAFDLFH